MQQEFILAGHFLKVLSSLELIKISLCLTQRGQWSRGEQLGVWCARAGASVATSPCSVVWSEPSGPQAGSLWTELPPPRNMLHARNTVFSVLMRSGLGHELVVQMDEKTGGCLPWQTVH